MCSISEEESPVCEALMLLPARIMPRRGIVLLTTGFSPWLGILAPPHPVVGAACIIKCIDSVGGAHYGAHFSIRSPSTG